MNGKPLLVVSLFDLTGIALKPWYNVGYKVLQIDLQSPSGLTQTQPGWFCYGGDCYDAVKVIEHVKAATRTEVYFMSCFPPCTDLAVSGARWFKAKRKANPNFQKEAMDLVFLSRDMIERYKVAGYTENPVSVISSLWRKPNYKFHPWHFTSRCLRDNYTKKTCIWTSDKFRMPTADIHPRVKSAVDFVIARLGRFMPKPEALALLELCSSQSEYNQVDKWYPDDRIHKAGPSDERANFRGATPEGWATAVAEVNQ